MIFQVAVPIHGFRFFRIVADSADDALDLVCQGEYDQNNDCVEEDADTNNWYVELIHTDKN